MTNAEMHAIQVQDTPVRLQRALAPGFKLLGERLIQEADRAGAGSDAHQGVGDFSYLMGTRSGHEHLRQPFCNMGLIATVALKGLRVKLSFTISGHLDLLEPTRGCHQIAAVGAITVLFAHDSFYHDPNGTLGQSTQVLMEDLLFW